MKSTDITIVGAGIIGLAHAWVARSQGLSVRIIEEAAGVRGASVRNFGHCCITGQTGHFQLLAEHGRHMWLAAARDAGFWAEESGAYALAAGPEELAVLAEAQRHKSSERIRLLDRAETRKLMGNDTKAVGGAFLTQDLRVDPREAAPKLAAWLAAQDGIEILYNTRVTGLAEGCVVTTRGTFATGHTLVCAGHQLKGLLPDLAESAQVRECSLNMALVAAPEHFHTDAAILTGTSLLRYDAFASTSAAGMLRERFLATTPQLIEVGANCMFTRRPDGTLIVGDSHDYATSVEPFLAESITETLLREIAGFLGVADLRVLQRWQGVYASSDTRPLIVESLSRTITAVTVATGIGMTISFGLAAENIARLTSVMTAA